MVLIPALEIALLALLSFVVLYTLRKQAQACVDAVLWILRATIGRIPFVGGLVIRGTEAALDLAARGFAIVLGAVAHDVADPVASFFNALAEEIENTAFSIASLASDTWDVVHKLRHTVLPRVIHAVTWPIRLVAHHAYALARYAVRLAHATEAELLRDFRYAERLAARAYAVAVEALDDVIAIDIPAALRALRESYRGLSRRLGYAALAGVVLAVLARVIPWYKCSNVNRTARQVCRTPFRFLDDVLALLADFAILTNICRVIPWLEAAFEATGGPLIAELAKAGAGICGAGYAKPPPLNVPPLHLPPTNFGQLYLP